MARRWVPSCKTIRYAQTVQVYLHADMALKERALARTTPHGAPTGRYHPPDNLIEFLNSL